MAEKKVSLLLSAKDALSPAFESAGKSLERMRHKAGDASAALGKLSKAQGDIKSHQATQKALQATNKQLSENKKRVDASGTALRGALSEQRRYQKGISSAEQSLRELDVELARNGRLTADQRVTFTRVTQSLEQLRPAYKKATAEVALKRREDKAATRETVSLTSAADKERSRLKTLGSALKSTGVDTRNLAREQARLATDATKASTMLARQEARIKTLNSAQSRMEANRATRSNLKGQVLGTAIAAAPLVAMGKKAMDAEYAWSDVQKVANFNSKKEERDFQLSIRRDAGNLGISQKGMTDIVAAAGQAGVANDSHGNVDTKQLRRFSVDAAKTAVAFDTDAGTAGDTLAKLRTSMKLNQDGMMQLADFINQASNQVAAKPMEVAAIMRRMGANVKLSGFSNNQTAALAATLIASGETQETGATAMKNISGRLTAGFATTKSGQRGLSMLGFEPKQLSKDMQKNAPETLIKVLEAVKKQSPDKQKAIISQIFGEEVSGAVAKLAGNIDVLKQMMGLAGDQAAYAGSMEKEYQKKAATRKAKMDRLNSRIETLTISLGDLLLPVVDELAPPIGALASGFSNLLETSDKAKSAFGWTLKIGASMVALKVGMMGFKFIGSLASDLKQLGRIGKTKLGGATDGTVLSANRATVALRRMNAQMDRLGGGRGTGAGGNGRGGSRRTRRGGRGAGSGGSGLSRFKGMGKLAGRAALPMQLAYGAYDLYDATQNGDASDVGAAVGSTGGGIGGAALGAAIGSFILPGIGTAIGGALGGIAGSGLGEAVGEKIGPVIKDTFESIKGWFTGDDKTKPASDRVSTIQPKDLTKVSSESVTQGIDAAVEKAQKEQPPPPAPITIKIEQKNDFDVKASGDPAQDNALAKKIKDMIEASQTKALHDALASHGVDSRMNASLNGQRSD